MRRPGKSGKTSQHWLFYGWPDKFGRSGTFSCASEAGAARPPQPSGVGSTLMVKKACLADDHRAAGRGTAPEGFVPRQCDAFYRTRRLFRVVAIFAPCRRCCSARVGADGGLRAMRCRSSPDRQGTNQVADLTCLARPAYASDPPVRRPPCHRPLWRWPSPPRRHLAICAPRGRH